MFVSFIVAAKVAFLRTLSSALVVWFTTMSAGYAHEVLPSIADMRSDGNTVSFEIRASLESFVAGIDLTDTSDTNESAQAQTYDELRALTGPELEAQFTQFWPEMAQGVTLIADGQALTPVLTGVQADRVGNIDLVRTSTIFFEAQLPPSAQTLQMGWDAKFGVLVLRQQDVPTPYDGFLQAGALSDPIPLAGGGQASGWGTFVNYVPVGFDHIVPKGLDHILFVLGLFFLAARLRPLLIQVSLFTVAHTITLALAALGYTAFIDDFFMGRFGLPFINVVEPLIALSIVYVAVENIFAKGISPWRPYVIFGFGLLHGLGFASVLAEFGLPDDSFVAALIGFNVGVEIGQLFVIALVFLIIWQALRIDRGQNEAGRGFAIYLAIAVSAVALSVLNPASMVGALENPVWLFGVPVTALALLCMTTIQFRDRVAAYRSFVAIPASIAIATVGAYWVIERVFL